MKGYVVITADRRLTVAEWIGVKILRRPDPRDEVYPVKAHAPGTPGPNVQTFTVSLPESTASKGVGF